MATKQHLMELDADEEAARTFATSICPELPVRKQTFTNTTALNRSHQRAESDLDDMRADVDEALAMSEIHTEPEPHDSTTVEPAPPSEEETAS